MLRSRFDPLGLIIPNVSRIGRHFGSDVGFDVRLNSLVIGRSLCFFACKFFVCHIIKDSSGFAVLLSANAMPELADLRPDFAEFGDNRYH